MLGTKWPSITSRWIQSAPAASTARTSSPNLAKSEARIDGAMTRGRDANCWDMWAFRKPLSKRAERFRVTRASLAGNAGKINVSRRKILPQRHQLPGKMDGSRYRKPTFYWLFRAGTAFADLWAVKVRGRAVRHLSEFCYAACSWRRVVRIGRPPITDLVEIVSKIDRLRSDRDEPVRFLRQRQGIEKPGAGFRFQRVFAAIASHHECAACGAKPVIDGINYISIEQPV